MSVSCKFKSCTTDTGLRSWQFRLSHEEKGSDLAIGLVKPMKRVSVVQLNS